METSSVAAALPTEILEKIFSYCSHRDLVQTVQKVCSRWRQVAESARLWKHLAYCPNNDASSEEIVELLKMSPKLETVILRKKHDDAVLLALTDSCPELKKLQICREQDVKFKFIKNLQEKCPKLEYLKVEDVALANKRMCETVAKFANLKVLLLTGFRETKFSVNLKPIADHCTELEHFEFWNYKFQITNLCYFLSRRREKLHTLGIRCCTGFGKCVLPLVSTCNLTSLCLFSYSMCWQYNEKIQHLGGLKTVRKLTIHGLDYEELDFTKEVFENENLAHLRELNIYKSCHFVDDLADIIVQNCPLLQTLTLDHCQIMTDKSLKMMHNLKELSSLTLSGNDRITDNGILHLQDLQRLNCLRIAKCCGVTNLGLQNIVKLSTLRDLVLWEQDLAEFPWDLIPSCMKFLRRLDIYSCRNVDTGAIKNLKRMLPHLKVILDGVTDSEHPTADDALICTSKIFLREI